MTNDLKNFLGVENRKEDVCYSKLAIRPLFYTDTIKGEQVLRDDMWAVSTEELHNHDTRLINFVLDLVEKEVKEYKNRIGMPSGFGEDAVRADESRDTLNHVSTIINNLRV